MAQQTKPRSMYMMTAKERPFPACLALYPIFVFKGKKGGRRTLMQGKSEGKVSPVTPGWWHSSGKDRGRKSGLASNVAVHRGWLYFLLAHSMREQFLWIKPGSRDQGWARI